LNSAREALNDAHITLAQAAATLARAINDWRDVNPPGKTLGGGWDANENPLAAAVLAGDAAAGRMPRGGASSERRMDPSGQAHRPASAVTESSEQRDLEEIDQMLGDLEEELRNTDTRIEIP